MPGNPRSLRRGTSSLPDPLDILGSASDGCKSGGILRVGLPGIHGGDAGGPAVPNHLHRGGGCVGKALDIFDGIGYGQAGRAQTG